MPVRFQLAQDGTSGGSSDVGHIGEIFVADIDFDRTSLSRADEAAITRAKQNRHKALEVVADHQVVGASNGIIEMFDR